jgi:hypothetical protein
LISRQEHEAWEVLLASQGQLRLAPTGPKSNKAPSRHRSQAPLWSSA